MSRLTLAARPLAAVANATGECPLWVAEQGALYWVDIPQGLVFRRDSLGHVERWQASQMLSALALTEAGGLVAATETGFAHVTLRPDGSASLDPICAVLPAGSGMRFNDGATDRQGRFWSGTMRMPPDPAHPVGVLHRLDADGVARPVVDGLLIQNGLAWSPDGRTMFLSDSHPSVRTIWCFDFDPETGTPGNCRVFCADLPGRPDGAAMDADGCYWIAATDAGKILRLTPDGRIDAEIVVPVPNPTNLCFGGPDMKTAFITSMPPKTGPLPMAGDLFVAELPFAGLPEPRVRLAPPT